MASSLYVYNPVTLTISIPLLFFAIVQYNINLTYVIIVSIVLLILQLILYHFIPVHPICYPLRIHITLIVESAKLICGI